MKSSIWRRGAAMIAAAALTATVVACSASGNNGVSGPADTSDLTFGADSDYATYGFDPVRYGDGQVMFFTGLYDQLFTIQPDGTTGPGLVTEWKHSDDKLKMTWTLRDGVTFTDGSTLTAELVKKNLDQRTNEALANYKSLTTDGAQEITSVEVTGDMTVELTFAKPQPAFEDNLTHTLGFVVGDSAVDNRDSMQTTPAGSGPYTLDTKASVKGSTYVFLKNDTYWNSAAYPYQKLTWSVVESAQARANALVSGETDVALLLDSKVVDFVEQKAKVARQGGVIQSLAFWDKKGERWEPDAVEEVREAFQFALDRKGLVDTLHPGEFPAFNSLPQDSSGFDPELETTYAFNPATAKQMLADAGYPDGVEFDITTSASVQNDLVFLQTGLAEAGITMNVKIAASTDELFRAAAKEPLGGPLAISWANPLGTMYGLVIGGFLNLQHATDLGLQDATDALAAAKTDDEKKTALLALNHRIMSSGWILPLYEQTSNYGYNPEVVKPITFPGSEQWPLLASFQPAQ